MADSSPIALATDGLSKRFGRHLAVDEVSLQVPAGQIVGLIGPNGAGKSTLMKMIFSLVRPSRGSIRVFGVDVRRNRFAALQAVGAMIETPSFYRNLSGRSNLRLFAALSGGVSRAQIEEAVSAVQLGDRIDDRVATYSHGMRQRLGIAQALLPPPRLAVLDEPADGLDPAAHLQMQQIIIQLARQRGVTVLLSSHLLGEVERICDQVAIMHRGRCLYQGALGPLLEEPSPRWHLNVDSPSKAARLLATLDGVEQISSQDHHLELCYPSSDPAPLIRELLDAQIVLHEIHRGRKTLEQRFLELTEQHGQS